MPLAIHELGLKLYDPDDLGVAATMSLVVNQGTITVSVGNSGVTIVSGNGSVSVNLSGTITQLANLLQDLTTGTISYSSSVAATKTFTITVTDATGQAGALAFSIDVQSAPPPVVTYPGATLQADTTGTVGVALNIHGASRFSITDADAGDSLITVTLTMDAGTATVTSGNSGVAIVSGNGTNSVVISGTVDNLDDLFDDTSNGTITWTGNLVGTRTFTVTAVDTEGGTDDANVTIVVGAVPVVAKPSAEIVATEDINTNVHGLGWAVTDADDAGGTATCVISTSVGTITVSVGDSGVTISSGNGTASVTLTGTISQLNNLLTDAGTGTITTTHTDPAIGTETVTITDSTSRVGINSQTVRFNADTSKWLGYVSGTLRPATSTITDFIAGIDLSRFPTTWWDVVSDNGRDIRVTLTDNVPRPRDLLLFDKAARTGFLLTRLTYSTSPPEIRIHAGALGATAPAVGDATGQYAVYPSYVRGYWPDGAGNDRTQYLNHFTAFGGYTAGDAVGLSGTRATTLSGVQYGITSVDVPVFDSIFMGAFINSASMTGSRSVLERTGSAPQQDRYRIFANTNVSGANLSTGIAGSGLPEAAAYALGTISTGSWNFLTAININSSIVVTRNGANSGGASTSGVTFVDAAPHRIVVGADRVSATDTIFGSMFVGNVGLAFFMTGAGIPTNNVAAQNYAYAHYAIFGNQPFWWGDWTFTAENLGGL